MQALLGIDIGASGCKALLISTDGGVIAADTATYPLSQPRPGWTEQNPELWVKGAARAVAGALAKAPPVEILCIGLSGQMHGLTPLDNAHQVLRPAILWNDQRNAEECAALTEAAGGLEGILAAALDAPQPNPDGRLQVFCNVAPDKWHCMGVSLNAGGAMGRFRDAICAGTDLSFEQTTSQAAASPAGARGLLFVPYLNGERCPHPDTTARGAFIGLAARHERHDMARALMEGVVHALADMQALMQPMGIDGQIIKASGGGARSELWRQMQADVFGCDVVTTEGAAFGAALVAGLGICVWPDATTAAACRRNLTREEPDPETAEVYARAHQIYRDLYPRLSSSFAALGAPVFDH